MFLSIESTRMLHLSIGKSTIFKLKSISFPIKVDTGTLKCKH